MPENKPHIHTAGEQFHDHGGNLEQLLEHMPDEEAFTKPPTFFSSSATRRVCAFCGCWLTAKPVS